MVLRVKPTVFATWITRAPGRSPLVHLWYQDTDGGVSAICDDRLWLSRRIRASRAKRRKACLPCREMYMDDAVGMARIRLVVQDENPWASTMGGCA